MNDSGGRPPYPEKISMYPGTGNEPVAPPVSTHREIITPDPSFLPAGPAVKPPAKTNGRKNHTLHKDSLFVLKREEISHVICEDYSYKADSYYTILQMEMKGMAVKPSSGAVIDAFVVPICLEKAGLNGIPVCEWEISQGYVPLPAILYGLNYFATTSEFFAVYDNEAAKEAVKHITNKGKYPFCYQKLGEDTKIFQCTVIFGKTIHCCEAVADMAGRLYALFSIPLMQMVLVRTGETYTLSSLAPARYSQMQENERLLLEAYLSHQEFL
jgi:hypothetical protein